MITIETDVFNLINEAVIDIFIQIQEKYGIENGDATQEEFEEEEDERR